VARDETARDETARDETARDETARAGQPTPTTKQLGWVRRLWQYMLRHRRSVIISLVGALLGSACQTVVPLIARQIVDGVIVPARPPCFPGWRS